MDTPTVGQLLALALASALFALWWGASLVRDRMNTAGVRFAVGVLPWVAIAVVIGTLAWHSVARGSWWPLEDNFDALVWLGLLLALFVAYIQATRPLRRLEWFTLPVVVLLFASAAVFGRTRATEYDIHSAWAWVHRVTSYGGAVAFAVAGAGGAMYLIAYRNLRRKTSLLPASGMGSLERLEHVTLYAVTLGFALLTVGIITGIARVAEHGTKTQSGGDWLTSPKVLLGFAVWVVYALVLHSPINPRFRGRRAAILSVVGFVLMIGSIVATQYAQGKT